jgi:hypothetical protein
VLPELGPEAAVGVPHLIRGLAAGNTWGTREKAMRALAGFGRRAARAEPILQRSLKASPPRERLVAATALGRINPRHPLVVPALLEVARKCPSYSPEAASSLRDMGPNAKAAVPWLVQMLDEGNSDYLGVAAALKAIDPAAIRKAGLD